jgi:hypothetical protein
VKQKRKRTYGDGITGFQSQQAAQFIRSGINELGKKQPKSAALCRYKWDQEGILPGTDCDDNLARPAVGIIAAIYLLTAGVLFYLLSVLWPVDKGVESAIVILHWRFGLSAEVRLIWLVVVTSALGSYIHTVTSFTLYAGNRSLFASWLAWYVLRPAISAALALIFYFALRAGLFSGATADQTINPFGIAAISGMVGMFSKQATEKLGKIFDTIFT